MNPKITEFRDGIFHLRTRRFGTVAEIMIKKLFQLDESHTLAFDKKDNLSNKRVEVKFSTVLRKNSEPITDENVMEQIFNANLDNRLVNFEELQKMPFDSNIQQIKRKEFDILYYGLFFADTILIFRMKTSHILSAPGYSDKQHRGNKGEGQFHMNKENLKLHQKYFIKQISYEELYDLLFNKISIH